MSSDSSGGNVTPKGSSSEISILPVQKKQKNSFPAPYWAEKITKNYAIIKLLEQNNDLRYALHKSPTLTREFIKHPNVSREVARDKKLALEIIRRPHLLQELANFHHYAHQQRRRERIKEFVRNMEREYIKDNYKDPEGLVIPVVNKNLRRASASEMSIAIARASIPKISAQEDSLAVRYIVRSSRLFLRHDVAIEHGHCFRTKRVNYYNVLNAQGRLMYRIFLRHKHVQSHIKPYELVVKDPDGATVFVFSQMRDKKYRHKLAVHFPQNKVIGYVEQRWGWPCTICPILLRNKDNERMIQISCTKRPFMSYCRYHSQFLFEIRAMGTYNVIGKISSEWIDTPPGAFESERIYGVCFPRDLATDVKIILLAGWMLVYIKYFSGKFEKHIHYNLNEQEQALVRLVEDSSEENQLKYEIPQEPPSDSEEERDQAVLNHYKRTFEVAAISAKKRIGIDNIVEDVNLNKKDHDD